jgi:DNA-binding NtrC family response regulator
MPAAGRETILIVDDHRLIRLMCEAILARYGYQPISTASGEETLLLLSRQPELQVDLVLLDIVMKDMSGPELAVELQRLRPGLPILFMTGFPDQLAILAERNVPVLKKPFTSVTLTGRIRQILDGPRVAGTSA